MLSEFLDHIEKYQLVSETDKILLAVSGGIDSVCMAHLFHAAGFHFGIVHCNFKLRSKESDDDQKFVESIASAFKSKLFFREFDTRKYAAMKNISVQMAARELRYKWFEELATSEKYTRVAIAHNRNDVAETFLINLVRGTGLTGLSGIREKNGIFIRPLLFSTRKSIVHYAKSHEISYREDSSNADIKYQRNLIRNKIIPLLEKINPSFTDTILQETEIFRAVNTIYQSAINKIREELITSVDEKVCININLLKKENIPAPLVFELISPYGFGYAEAEKLLELLDGESGKRFISGSHTMVKDRNYIIIEKNQKEVREADHLIESGAAEIESPIKISIKKFPNSKGLIIPASPFIATIDFDKLKFPLRLRHWQKGDFFVPLGLKGRKKLSDFFVDRKINLHDKKKIWLLCSEEKIVWVAGYQIDDRFKVTPDTRNIIQFRQMN